MVVNDDNDGLQHEFLNDKPNLLQYTPSMKRNGSITANTPPTVSLCVPMLFGII